MGNLLNRTYVYPYGEAFHDKQLQTGYLNKVYEVLPEASLKGIINHRNCLGCITCLMQKESPYTVFITLWLVYIKDGDSIRIAAQRLLYNMIFSAIYHKKYEYWLLAFAITKSLRMNWPYMQICKMPNNSFWTVILHFDNNTYRYANFNLTRYEIADMERMQNLIESLKYKPVEPVLATKIVWPKTTNQNLSPNRNTKRYIGLRDPYTYM